MKPVTPDGRSSRWDEHRRRRRMDLLRTVRRAIAEHGSDISMDQISSLSGTSKTVLYRYFGDRAGLQLAMGAWAMDTIQRSLDNAPEHAEDERAAMGAMIEAFTELASRAPHVYMFSAAAVMPQSGDPAAGFFHDVTALLCRRMGLEHDVEILWAHGAIGFVRSATEQWLLRSAPDRSAFNDHLTAWLWASSQTLLKGQAR